MSETQIDPQKRKHSRRRPWGCLILLLIPVMLVMAGYGGMWLFAHYGGEWALKDRLPIPPNAEKIYEHNWQYDEYTNFRSELYDYKGSVQDLIAWYTEQGFESQEYDDRYDLGPKSTVINGIRVLTPSESQLVSLYKESLSLTSDRWGPEVCTDGTIFKTHEAVPETDLSNTDLPHVDLTGKNIIFRRISCWPLFK